MKKLILLLLLSCCSQILFAVESDITLLVELKDGTKHEYLVADKPKIEFAESQVVFVCKNITAQYNKADLQNFVFLNENEVGIQKVGIGDTRIFYSEDNQQVTIEGITDTKQIRVYSLNGQLQQVTLNSGNGRIEMSLASLPKGYYIVSLSNKQTIKILK